MACGCISACGCNVVGDHTTAEVVRTGDTFTVSAILPIKGIDDTDCIVLSLDDDLILIADPVLADAADEDASVQLRCTETGLAGDVVIDPASTAPVTLTDDGLRIDLPAPLPSAESASPGTLKATSALGDEAGWVEADGAEVSRLTFPDLHDAVSLVTSVGVRTNGSAQLTNVKTRFLAPGMPAEIDGFPPGLTVVSIDGAFTLTVSDVAFSDGADTVVRVYPYGNGDGSGSTFNLPLVDEDGFVKQMVEGEGLGAPGGASTTNLTVAQMPAHEHPGTSATDSGHGHGVTDGGHGHSLTIASDGTHNHEPGTARDSEFVTVEDPLTAPDFISIASFAGTTASEAISIPTYGGAGNYQQGNRSFTSNDGSHDHAGSSVGSNVTGISVNNGTANISVDVAMQGSSDDIDNRPLHRAFRWMVKT